MKGRKHNANPIKTSSDGWRPPTCAVQGWSSDTDGGFEFSSVGTRWQHRIINAWRTAAGANKLTSDNCVLLNIFLFLPCSANKLKRCISITTRWIFCLTKRNESLQFFKGPRKEWWENVRKETKKPSRSSSFDQHYNLITCTPKRSAFV